MQVLYTLETQDITLPEKEGKIELKKKINQSHQLYVYLFLFMAKVARYAEKDAARKAGKHLPTQEDLSVKTKISGNEIVWQIWEDPSFQQSVKAFKLDFIEDEELLKDIYQKLIQTPEYAEYSEDNTRIRKNEKAILEFLLNDIMLPNENFTEFLEEQFFTWDDDAEMMQIMAMSYLKHTPKIGFNTIIDEEKEKFAFDLVDTVISKKDHLLSLIKPKLKNWDADRIAALDMILLQMGISEFLYFDTIPTKVTINEYIDLAKAYSTNQSGQFINGILDNVHKELISQEKIEKKSYK